VANQGRPDRHDADYFKFYAKDGKTLFVLQHKYGLEGIGFFTNLFRLLTSTPDHHICIADPGDALYVFSRIGVDEDRGLQMIEDMVLTGKLHKRLWEQYRVIVSPDLLKSLEILYEKRNNDIITIEEIEKMFSDTGNTVDETFRHRKSSQSVVSGGDNTHTREEKSRVEKSTLDIRARGSTEVDFPGDALFVSLRNSFQAVTPVFADPEKEVAALHDICRLVRARAPTNETQFAKALVETFYYLTKKSGDAFYRKKPFKPARLKSHFDDIVARMEYEAEKSHEEAAIFDEEYEEEQEVTF
jgi:hypothetical protein